MADTQTLTEEQVTQHKHVLAVAQANLAVVTDQVESLHNQMYDAVLECLDSAKSELEKVVAKHGG